MKKCIWILVAALLITGAVQADAGLKPKAAMDVRASVGQGGVSAQPACLDFPVCTGFEQDCSTDGTGDDGWGPPGAWMCDPFSNGNTTTCQAAARPFDPNNECPGTNCCAGDPNSNSGWYLSISSQQCVEPHIAAACTSQALCFDAEPALGCTGWTGDCRITAFTADSPSDIALGPVTVRLDVSGSAYGGANLEWWTQSGIEGLRTTRTWLDWYGTLWVQDGGLGYVDTGIYWIAGPDCLEWMVEVDPCANSIVYSYNGAVYWVDTVGIWAGAYVDGAFFMTDNYDTTYCIDNYCVTRGGACPNECGNAIVEVGEECEADADCGLGTCIPPNGGKCVGGFCDAGLHVGEACVFDMDCDDPADCMCIRACDDPGFEPECELDNGENTFMTFGGWAYYVADTPATAFDLCGTTGNDTFLVVYWMDGGGMLWMYAYNDDCGYWDPYGMQDPLASCYYPYISFEWYESCTCAPTTIGDVYFVSTDYFGEGPVGHTTVINIEKRMICPEYFLEGACCDAFTGECTDFVPAQECKEELFHQSKLCEFLDPPCAPMPMACCDTTPGMGGVCVDDVLPAECDGPQLVAMWPDCASVVCAEMTGACCDHTPGMGGMCTEGVLMGDCQGPQFSWYKDTLCIDVDCNEAVGACCNSDAGPLAQQGLCEDGLLFSECGCEKCSWFKGELCATIECPANFVAIPTVSEWGLVILTLLLLAGAKVYFTRREATA